MSELTVITGNFSFSLFFGVSLSPRCTGIFEITGILSD